MHAERSQRFVLNDDSLEPEDNLRFHLTYEGPLRGSFNGEKRASEKHTIRKEFHRQLRNLWKTPPLNRMFQTIHLVTVNAGPKSETRLDYLYKNYARLNGHFIPLVTEDMGVWCGIDVLFLRSGKPGKVFKSGDIDNRMKTLLDALKMPEAMQDLGGQPFPAEDEDPFFCLLQDDGLVPKFSVEADTLLQPLDGGIPKDSDARLIITVELRPISSVFGGIA